MAGNLKIRDAMHAEVLHKFIIYTEFRNVMPKAELLMGEEGVLFTANEAFLEYFYLRSLGGIQGTTLSQQEQFEHYFTTNGEDKNQALIAYWNEQGYQKYCQLLATPGVKLAQNDVAPVINLLGQRLTIYNPNAMILREIEGNMVTPKMEIVLYAADGHYCLLNTNTTTTVFAEYAQSYAQYKKDRTETLASIDNKLTVANTKPSLLIGAICPTGLLEKDPFALLLDKVDVMSNFVIEFDKTKEQEEAQRRKEQEEAQRRKEQEEAQRRKEQEEAQRRKEQEDSLQRRKVQEEDARRAQIGLMFAKIDVALRGLNNKIGLVEQHRFQVATSKAQESLAQLKKARDEYYIAFEHPDADRIVASENFKKECAAIINKAKPILTRDLGWGDYLGNLLKSLLNIVIYGITLGTVHSFFTSVKSVSLEALEQAESVLVC
ncbi:flotillin family protein [Legionella drancourtii]|uniref:Uncharacterized protein n=1 Tax=Legionella drancourtii LLAP12 TaxID=658187 RepID=G9EJK0_9GAMM|nr:hypothetical protein [Legionella drancourtii]EHL32410.1 hypothetical protein LDG_5366 [Legionella drancourtii LLAP12]